MRAYTVLALSSLLLFSREAAAQDQPFAAVRETFWRSADPGFADNAVLWVSSETLALSTPCFYTRDVFTGAQGKPQFNFRSDYEARGASGCDLKKSEIDIVENKLRGTAAFDQGDSTLMLKDANGSKIASFNKIAPTDLEFRWWTVSGYRSGRKMVQIAPQDEQRPQMLFFNGTLIGTPGAGEFAGSYTLQNGHLKISTGLYCVGNCLGDKAEARADEIIDLFKTALTFNANGSAAYTVYDSEGHAALELTEERIP